MPNKEKEQQRHLPEDRPQTAYPYGYLETIAKIGPRPTGSENERNTALYIKETLKSQGIGVSEERFLSNASVFRPHLFIFLFVIAMGALPTVIPPFSLGLLLASVGCLYARKIYTDLLNHKDVWLLRFLPKKKNQNILAKINPKKEIRNRIVFLSHLDSAICSPIFSDKMVRSLRSNIFVDRILFASMGVLYLAAIVMNDMIPYYIAIALGLYVLGSILVLLYSEIFSPPSPGVNDNATGIATVMSLAQTFQQTPLEHMQVWCVFLGAEESGALGSRAFWENHQEALRNSYIVNIDSVGIGNLRYVVNEGFTEEYACDAELIGILSELRRNQPELGLSPFVFKGSGGFTDCTHLLQKGCRATTLVATESDGFIKNWHTPNDKIEDIQKDVLQNAFESAHHMALTLDERSKALGLVPGIKSYVKKFSPGHARTRIFRTKMLEKSNFHLRDILWPEFDEQAEHVFHQTTYLEAQALSSRVENGFILLEEAPKKPIALVPYFVYYELIDDGAAPRWLRRFARMVKVKMLNYDFPIFPGFKTLFLGTPFTQPTNKIFTRPGVRLEDIMNNETLMRSYRNTIRRLQLRYLAPVVSHVNFSEDIDNDRFLRSQGFAPFPAWPENYLDFQKIRWRIKERLKEGKQEAQDRVDLANEKLEELKKEEQDLLHVLEADPIIKTKAQEKNLRIDAEERQLLLAADAQNQIDDLTESLKTGKYIQVMKKKLEDNYKQREEMFPNYRRQPRKTRRLIAELLDLDGILKEAQKQKDRHSRNLKKNREKIKNLIERSLCNKYEGIVPTTLDFSIKFFIEKGEEISPHKEMPEGWTDITPEDALRRIRDLEEAKEERDQLNLSVRQFSEKISELKEKYQTTLDLLTKSFGNNLKQDLKVLLKSERRQREIDELNRKIEVEKKYLTRLKMPIKRNLEETPERLKLIKAIEGAKKRRIQAIRALGIVKKWNDLPKFTRDTLKQLADIHLKIRKTDLRGVQKNLKKKKEVFEKYDDSLAPSFDDYVESLSVNNRATLRKNMEKIRATQKDYEIEVTRDPARIVELSDLLYQAYQTQFRETKVQWLKLSQDYFRRMADVTGTQLIVCWHIQDEDQKKFAGFIMDLDSQFNHRMGIMPEYKKKDDKSEDDHLVYFRLTYRNIEENLNSNKDGMWIAQTTYKAKGRLGFETQSLVNYRRSISILGFHLLSDHLYQKIVGNVMNSEHLYEY